MAWINYESISLAPTTSGAYSVTSANTYNGFVRAIRYVASTATPFSTANNIAVAADRSGISIISVDQSTASVTWYPVTITHSSTGATSTGYALVPLFNERVTITVTSGSTAGTAAGTLHLFVS